MATKHILPPAAASLIESMRDLGYSLATAVADIVDNSIAARATEIKIFCDLTLEQPVFIILDNGRGMSPNELFMAMKPGSVHPRKKRRGFDLGRFGLGLKTSSFSQCRHLSVVSSKKSKCVGAVWDLDIVEAEDDWIISSLNKNEIKQIPYINHLPETGTAIIWQKLDRIFEDQIGPKRVRIVNEKLDLVEKHLALVFHRFLSGDVHGRPKITIAVNGHQIEPFDPFCRKNKATRLLPKDIVRINNEEIHIQPYILPHHSHLSEAEYAYYQDRSDFLSNQGAYIYRNGRLMIWGDWFHLAPKGEATKLARICIDFPSSLDEKWAVDIKKSKARPPYEVRLRVKQIISKVTEDSSRTYRGRGQKLFEQTKSPIWERHANRKNVRYELNKNHPLLIALEQSLNSSQRTKFRTYTKSVVSSLPVEMIYSDFSLQPQGIDHSENDAARALDYLKELKAVVNGDATVDSVTFRRIVESTRSFSNMQDIVNRFINDEFSDQ